MATSYPYISGPGNIKEIIKHLRKSFPQTVNSETVKKLGLAPKNESCLINALQFIGIIDEEGKKTSDGSSVFSHHKDEDFSKEFSSLVKKSYHGLFELHGDDAWTLDIDELITFFRRSDNTSDAIGKRQASTFKVFAAVSGHIEFPAQKTTKSKPESPPKRGKTPRPTTPSPSGQSDVTKSSAKNIGLTVRIEINLPSDGTKEIYDNIFKSIKENLIDG